MNRRYINKSLATLGDLPEDAALPIIKLVQGWPDLEVGAEDREKARR